MQDVYINGFMGADGIQGPPLPVPASCMNGAHFLGPMPPSGWTFEKDGYAFLQEYLTKCRAGQANVPPRGPHAFW